MKLGIDPFEALESVMSWDKLVSSIEEAKQLSRPIDYDYLDLLENRFTHLRKYTPTLLNALEFRSTQSAEPLLKAIQTIKDMNDTGKRKVPEGAPLDFVPNRWQKHVYDDDGSINRHYYEMAVLSELRNLVPAEKWKQEQSRMKLSSSLSVEDYLRERLAQETQ